jgi:hypothetical protein
MAEARTKRSPRKRSPKKDLEVLESGTLEQMVAHFGDEAGAHRAYEQLVDELPRRTAERASAWWLFEANIPDELRGREGEQDEELHRRRRAWLGDRYGE